MEIKGEIKTIAAREGSSGILTGDIEGLYQGYRFGSTTPDEREFTLMLPNGTIALRVRQGIVTPLPSRPAEHPFADGKDPFEALAAGGPPPGFGPPGHGGPPPGVPAGGGPPPGVAAGGGPPPGVAAGGGPPPGVAAGGGPPPGVGGEAPGMEGGQEIFRRVHYMEVMAEAIPEKCTGIFEGATAEVEIMAPAYRMAGYMLVDTDDGQLRLDFLEKGSREKLDADLWVNGEESTGKWKGASGELKFSLDVTPPVFGQGPYWGTITLAGE